MHKMNEKKDLIDSESLFFTENNLREQLRDCEYWGELKLSRMQYEQLCEFLTQKHNELPESKRIETLYKEYPVSMITSMVFYIVFDYQDEFWNNWAAQVGINLTPVRETFIGKAVREYFDKNGFTYETDGYKNVTPLLCQAGIPDSNLDDLFQVMSTVRSFDPDEIIQEMQGWRKYQIRKPIERFIRLHERKMTSLLLTVNDVMKNNENLYVDDLYEQRIAEKFDFWKTENLNKNGTYRRKTILQEKPHLVYDGTLGLCMILPEYFLENEYCSEIMWKISSDGEELYSLCCNVITDGLRTHTVEKKIPLRVCNHYTVSIFDPENSEGLRRLSDCDWELRGSGDGSFLLFDNRGKHRIDQTYPMDGGILLLQKNCIAQFESTWHDDLALSLDLNYRVIEFIPKDNSSCIRINNEENSCLRVRKNVKTMFRGGKQLFADVIGHNDDPIFTELPDIGISIMDTSQLSVMVRNRDTGYKNSFSLNDEIDKEENELWRYYDLQRFLPDEHRFGRYALRIYDRGDFKKELEFAFVPSIEFNDSAINLWPTQKSAGFSALRYKISKEMQIEFTSPIKSSNEKWKDEYWKRVEALDDNHTFLDGMLLLDDGNIRIPFKKRFYGLQWTIWNQNEAELHYNCDIKRLSKTEYQDACWQLTMRIAPEIMAADNLKLCLYSSSKELLQESMISPNRKGIWNLNLGQFSVTMENRKFPMEFYLVSENKGIEYHILEIYEPIMMEGLRIKKGVPQQQLIWTKSNIEDIENQLTIQSLCDYDEECRAFENIQSAENEFGEPYYYVTLEPPLKNGIYKITQAETDDFFFDFEERKIEALPEGNVFRVNPASEMNKIDTNCVSAFIKALTIAYCSPGPLDKVNKRMQVEINNINGILSENDLKQMAALTLYVLGNEQGENEAVVGKMLQTIYHKLMKDTERQQFYELFIHTDLTENEKNRCRLFYRMDYISLKEFRLTQQDIRYLLEYDIFVGIRALLLQPKEGWIAEPLMNHIGIDVLSDLIDFGDRKESWILLFENLLSGKELSHKIEIHENLIGNSGIFYEMFDWGARYDKPKLNLDKKPKDELIFWGDGYINLLVKWYYQGMDKHLRELEAAKKITPAIDEMVKKAVADAVLAVKTYGRRINCRETESKSGFYPVLKASSACGLIFALLEKGMVHLQPAEKQTLNEFISLMDQIFPELLKRDILLAQLYLFMIEV